MSRRHGITGIHRGAWLALLALISAPAGAVAQLTPPGGASTATDPFAVRTLHDPLRELRREVGVAPWFELRADFRLRGEVAHNLDLNHGPTPSTGRPLAPVPLHRPGTRDTISSANLRVRLEPTLRASPEVALHLRIDALDNLVLGSTPAGFPSSSGAPDVAGSLSQEPPLSGRNSFRDSLAVKRAWVEILTPVGAVLAGRMGSSWGLGVLAAAGDGLDDDEDFDVDRIGFVTPLVGHLWGVAFDFNANGPSTASSAQPFGQAADRDDADDVRTLSVAILRRRGDGALERARAAGRWVIDYGLTGSHRWQDVDLPAYALLGLAGEDRAFSEAELVPRALRAWAIDLWLRVTGPRLALEIEAIYAHAEVGDASPAAGIVAPALRGDAWGGVARLSWRPPVVGLGLTLEAGVASGDPAHGFGSGRATGLATTRPGDVDGPQIDVARGDLRVDNLRFHPNYHVDEILWRRLVGTVTGGWYVRGQLGWRPRPWFDLSTAVIGSAALHAASAPGLAKALGVEWDSAMVLLNSKGYGLKVSYALLVPLDGFRNVALDLDPEPAHLGRLLLFAGF